MRFVCMLACVFALATTATAGPIVLDFEGLANNEAVANYYNGGLGGSGSGPGANYGISFSSNALAIIDADAGGTGNFANEPSPDTVMYFLTGSAIMNVSAGFSTGFSFWYANDNTQVGSVDVYDGVNGTGTLLASLVLPLAGTGPGDPNGGTFGAWKAVGVAFAGVARSVDFGGSVNQIAFDNITLGSETPGNPVPEPGSLLLLAAGLAGFGLFRFLRRS